MRFEAELRCFGWGIVEKQMFLNNHEVMVLSFTLDKDWSKFLFDVLLVEIHLLIDDWCIRITALMQVKCHSSNYVTLRWKKRDSFRNFWKRLWLRNTPYNFCSLETNINPNSAWLLTVVWVLGSGGLILPKSFISPIITVKKQFILIFWKFIMN